MHLLYISISNTRVGTLVMGDKRRVRPTFCLSVALWYAPFTLPLRILATDLPSCPLVSASVGLAGAY